VSKYDSLKLLKETKARKQHRCDHCGSVIKVGDTYYREALTDRRIRNINSRKFCQTCYDQQGGSLTSG